MQFFLQFTQWPRTIEKKLLQFNSNYFKDNKQNSNFFKVLYLARDNWLIMMQRSDVVKKAGMKLIEILRLKKEKNMTHQNFGFLTFYSKPWVRLHLRQRKIDSNVSWLWKKIWHLNYHKCQWERPSNILKWDKKLLFNFENIQDGISVTYWTHETIKIRPAH